MSDTPETGKSMSRAATRQMQEQRATEAVGRLRKKDTERIKVEAVVYSHVSRWVKKTIAVGEPIPLLHVKPSFGAAHATFHDGSDEVRSILDASTVVNTSALRAKIKILVKVRSDIEAMIQTLNSLDYEQIVDAEIAARNLHTTVEGRVVTALGACNAAQLGLDVIFVGLAEELNFTKMEIDNRQTLGPGRAKDEAAHRVALEAAKLYAKVTGKHPTYSEGSNGLSGHYTPFLRDLYDAFGWKSRSLRTGADAAKDSLKTSDLEPPISAGLRTLLTYRFT